MGLKRETFGQRGLTTVEDEAIMFMAGTLHLGLMFVF